jgi:hypothetical protein
MGHRAIEEHRMEHRAIEEHGMEHRAIEEPKVDHRGKEEEHRVDNLSKDPLGFAKKIMHD